MEIVNNQFMDIKDLEKVWRSSQPQLTDDELLTIFPEAKIIIPQKIQEGEKERKQQIQNIKRLAKAVKTIAKRTNKDEFFIWFWGYAYPKYFLAPAIVKIDRNLRRLRLLKHKFNKPKSIQLPYADWDELKMKAKRQSLGDIALPHLNKARIRNSYISACCPFHKEHNPSFVVYTNKNTYHCFVCQAHGDVISFYMNVNKVSFKDAVKELAL